jgi:hypothetical protein
MDFYYRGNWRMDWGLGNPNKTACLIACLMVAVWAVPFFWKRGFWPALVIFTALAWCLVETYSRGGMLAFLAGMGVLLLWTPRPWPKARWMGVVASVWIVGGFVLYAKAQTRYGQGLFSEDQSIIHRLVIWRHVPEMMAAAPWGWGFGKAGDSYTQWYQPFRESLNYFNLVNSHFTWMVEGGWLASVLYLFGWMVVLIFCWPVSGARFKAIPLAMWVAFAVAAFFSHVEESAWLWVLPVLALAYAGGERWRAQKWPSPFSLGASGAVAVALVVVLVLTGLATRSLPLSLNHGVVAVGSGEARTVILVDRKVMGSLYGHTFRRFLANDPAVLDHTTFLLSESSVHLPSMPKASWVVSGRFTENDILPQLPKGSSLILVNPSALPEDAGLGKGLAGSTLVYFGEYCQAPSRSSWSSYPGIKTLEIEGASDFVPSWPQAILAPPKT